MSPDKLYKKFTKKQMAVELATAMERIKIQQEDVERYKAGVIHWRDRFSDVEAELTRLKKESDEVIGTTVICLSETIADLAARLQRERRRNRIQPDWGYGIKGTAYKETDALP